jgi:isopenicillin N synthase-like dioxygenase
MPSVKEVLPEFPDDVDTVPLFSIDFAKIEAGDEYEIDRFFKASQELGFFYLTNSGVDPSDMFTLCADFFDNTPDAEKLKYDMGVTGNYIGYKAHGSNVVDARGTPDQNEFFNMAKDDLLGNNDEHREMPSILEERKHLVAAYMRRCHGIIIKMLEILAIRLGLPPSALSDLHRIDHKSGDMVRYIKSYTPNEDVGRLSLGEHTGMIFVNLDYEILTRL